MLSFPIDGDELTGHDLVDDVPRLLGDVVICPAVAAANAPEHAGSYDDEIALLLVHGVLHLLGMDHAERRRAVPRCRRASASCSSSSTARSPRDPWARS